MMTNESPASIEVELETVPCLLCGTSAAESVLMLDAGANGRIVRCRQCTLTYVSPRPVSTLSLYEDAAYFSAGQAESDGIRRGYDAYLNDAEFLTPYFDRVARAVAERRGERSGRLLEVGCAAGFFLERARRLGFSVQGVEPSRDAARVAVERFGLDVQASPLEQAKLDAGSFDVIVLLQTIEHVRDPAATLAHLRELMKPGGLLLMTTPNQSSWLARLSRSRWFEYKPPEHLVYFTPETMTQLLGKARLADVEIRRDVHRYPPDWVLGRLERYVPPAAPLSRIVRRVAPRGMLDRSLPVYYGSMQVWARREGTR